MRYVNVTRNSPVSGPVDGVTIMGDEVPERMQSIRDDDIFVTFQSINSDSTYINMT